MRLVPLLLLTGLTGCSGLGVFYDHAFSLPGSNPNVPMADSENLRRAMGYPSTVDPLQPEPGNVWPQFDTREPTLSDVANNPQREDQRGFPPASTPGQPFGLPAGRQPRPGSSSPPPPASSGPALDNRQPSLPAPSTPPLSNAPPPPGGVVQTPQGPAIDAGGTNGYRQLTTPSSPGAIVVPNGNGTSTVINPNGTIQTIPTPH